MSFELLGRVRQICRTKEKHGYDGTKILALKRRTPGKNFFQKQHLWVLFRRRGGRNSQSVQAMLATIAKRVHGGSMSAVKLLREVRALSPNERQKFVFALLDCEETALSAPAGRSKRVKWPDVQARARRIFGKRVFPNLVLLERSEQN